MGRKKGGGHSTVLAKFLKNQKIPFFFPPLLSSKRKATKLSILVVHRKCEIQKSTTKQEGSMMKSLRYALPVLPLLFVYTFLSSQCLAEISIGVLTKEKAKDKYGITMHARKNGDAGIKVWLEFTKEGWLEKFSYAELRMKDSEGKHMISAQLQPNPVHYRQPKDITTVAFSVDADRLEQCSFLVVCYGSNEGDVGYFLNVKDFLDLKNPITEK